MAAADEFKKLVAQLMQSLRLGDPREPNTDMGPQADSKQAATVASYLQAGAQDGHALVGGKRALDAGDNFIHPTVFSNIPDKSKLDMEEIFGPVMVLHEFETEDEAVRRANDTECRLTCDSFSILSRITSNLTRFAQTDCTLRFSRRTSAGLCAWHVPLRPAMSASTALRRTAPMSYPLAVGRCRALATRKDVPLFWNGPRGSQYISITRLDLSLSRTLPKGMSALSSCQKEIGLLCPFP